MFVKIVRAALLLAAVCFLGTSASADAAFVFKFDPGGCTFGWANFNFQQIALPGEAGMFVDTSSGNISLVCHGQIPNDGSVPSIQQVGTVLGLGDTGALVLSAENVPGALCNAGGTPTADFQETVSASGRVTLVCKVHP